MSESAKMDPGMKLQQSQAWAKGDPVALKEVGEITHDEFCDTVHRQALPNDKLEDELSSLSVSAATNVFSSTQSK
ncbi:hypothetical protein SAY87_020188 [Trapa incisa]|uniref:Uncharacterized protein n=1 Tax=Trapa incisa TaxID=236973 RepID=A0AAN7K770_9MYRT|nr:hypothetical protein SAY87_020188 [Trapa incisa]